MAFRVELHAFSGCSPRPRVESDRDDARAEVARRLRRMRRAGMVVSVVERGAEWEISDPDDAVMVSDYAGLLTLRAECFECRECGAEHDDEDDARMCCHLDDDGGGMDYDEWRDWSREEV